MSEASPQQTVTEIGPGQIWLSKDGLEEGPLSADAVRARLESGDLSVADYLFQEGWPEWVRVGQTDIANCAAAATPTAPPPPLPKNERPVRAFLRPAWLGGVALLLIVVCASLAIRGGKSRAAKVAAPMPGLAPMPAAVLDVSSGEQAEIFSPRFILVGHKVPSAFLRFSADSTQVFSRSEGFTTESKPDKCWSLTEKRLVTEGSALFRKYEGERTFTMQISSDKGDVFGLERIGDPDTSGLSITKRDLRRTVLKAVPWRACSSMVLSEDGKALSVVTEEELTVFSTADLTQVGKIRGAMERADVLSPRPLVLAGSHSSLTLYSLKTGAKLAYLPVEALNGFAVSPDLKYVACGVGRDLTLTGDFHPERMFGQARDMQFKLDVKPDGYPVLVFSINLQRLPDNQ